MKPALLQKLAYWVLSMCAGALISGLAPRAIWVLLGLCAVTVVGTHLGEK